MCIVSMRSDEHAFHGRRCSSVSQRNMQGYMARRTEDAKQAEGENQSHRQGHRGAN